MRVRHPRVVSELRLRGAFAARAIGFTLIELVVVMALLLTVLTVSYRVIIDCLDTHRQVDRIVQPEKIGEGVMLLFRRDLAGTYFRHFGRDVFRIADTGSGEEAQDEILFLTTTEPTPIEEAVGGTNVVYELRTIMGVHYFLRHNPAVTDARAYTLFRKEMAQLDPNGPLESTGVAYEVYDKIRYISISCFDGEMWYDDWDSVARIEEEEIRMTEMAEQREGRIGRVSDAAASAPGVAPEDEEPSVLPPTAVPVAVRIEIGVFLGQGNKLDLDRSGAPQVKTFAATIPLIGSQRLAVDVEGMAADANAAGDAGFGGADGDDPIVTRTGLSSTNPGDGGERGGRFSRRGGRDGGARSPGRGGGRFGGRGPGSAGGRFGGGRGSSGVQISPSGRR